MVSLAFIFSLREASFSSSCTRRQGKISNVHPNLPQQHPKVPPCASEGTQIQLGLLLPVTSGRPLEWAMGLIQPQNNVNCGAMTVPHHLDFRICGFQYLWEVLEQISHGYQGTTIDSFERPSAYLYHQGHLFHNIPQCPMAGVSICSLVCSQPSPLWPMDPRSKHKI